MPSAKTESRPEIMGGIRGRRGSKKAERSIRTHQKPGRIDSDISELIRSGFFIYRVEAQRAKAGEVRAP